jgi:predicted lactoylglutathione lyase
MEQRISLVTLGVKDLALDRAFYEAMGWSGASQPDDEVLLPGGRDGVGLDRLGGHGAPGVELAHNVRAPEVGAVLSAAERAGGTIKRPAAKAEWAHDGAFADRKGTWEVAFTPDWKIDEDGSIRIR